MAESIKPDALRQKAQEYRQQAETMLANYHRLIGAAIAYEEVAKGAETVVGPVLSVVPESAKEA